jgi:hypothetical protein
MGGEKKEEGKCGKEIQVCPRIHYYGYVKPRVIPNAIYSYNLIFV